ncbi:hypothetical protein Patl1_01991 [Pistacia atlantica]|uniref:Uncharacterized protein n=1 Tax=Pistacia atlantica TaxID=434234 RepID=A0ACC1C446_9ROSI|nr:hypothetical protein Patl1_01991 [Pistacia atlantica]
MKQKILEAEENVKKLKEAYEMTKTRGDRKRVVNAQGFGQMQAGIDRKAEDEKIKATQEALEHCKINLEAVINVFKQEKIGILSDTLGPSCHEENDVSLEISTHGENGEVREVTQASSKVNLGNIDIGVPQKQNDPHGEAFETVFVMVESMLKNWVVNKKNFEDVEELDAAIEQEADKEVEGSMQKEGEMEKENVRKVDKIKEKEREKEKERIDVERAVRKAHERVFTKAREMAKRATVEKAIAEAC